MTIYRSTVSLGAWCQTAHHLKRCGISREKSLFDWNFTYFNVLCGLVENDFRNFFMKDNLCFDDTSVLDTNSGMRFMHLFTRSADNKVDHSTIMIEYDNAKRKIDHLVQLWFQRVLSDERYLYILSVDKGWIDGRSALDVGRYLINLLKIKYPAHQFDLLVVSTEEDDTTHSEPGLFIRQAAIYQGGNPDNSWMGDDTSWNSILNSFRPLIGPNLQEASAQPAIDDIRYFGRERITSIISMLKNGFLRRI